jgi:hypothetical protein
VLRDRMKAEAMGKSGRTIAEARFGLARQCDQFVSIYGQMLAETSAGFSLQGGKTMQAAGRNGI